MPELNTIAGNGPSVAELQERIKELEQRFARQSTLTLKVSKKGAVSVYGLGRWPVTLYREQMERFLALAPKIQSFMTLHARELTSKADKEANPMVQ